MPKRLEIGIFTGYSLLLTALSIPDDGKEQWLCLIHLWLHKAENLAGRIALNSTKYWQLILASKYLKLH
ncbi:hypothetical protein PVL29_014109 [Vitis rotundifolia]|uniref:Uncharacterized protein n=1 Tax=Vitis rotundifolia TaxID=103349 RepID=A0AA39DLS7_VITRO|nr:hypothetical protein PVL29_014109 [Vitis rotundifolia]